MNRQITGRISTFHFAPTELSKSNLLKEGVDESNIIVTGNTVIDALHIVAHAYNIPALWFKFTGMINKDNIKFYDYFSSVDIINYQPFTKNDIFKYSKTNLELLFSENKNIILPPDPNTIHVLSRNLINCAPFSIKCAILKQFN